MQYGATRTGLDAPALIQHSASLGIEASEFMPGEPRYDLLIPFYPVITDGSGGSVPTSSTADGHPIWQQTPTRCDLVFYQGDDVVIPLYFNDPSLLGDDMEEDFEWFSQIRVTHRYQGTLVASFTVKATYHPAEVDQPDILDEYTMVEMYLPRSKNTRWGIYEWEIYSCSPSDMSRFPKPDDVDSADWPPPDVVRTWLYGQARICPRTTSTDFLPTPAALPPGVDQPAVMTNGGWVVGPNGRVP
jgi:hypothetical protein